MKRDYGKFFHRQIIADVLFLYITGIIDYSLLVGIGEEEGIYSFSIIDYCHKYNWQKKLEHFFKALQNSMNTNLISCVNQKTYYKRFLNFVLNITAIQYNPSTSITIS